MHALLKKTIRLWELREVEESEVFEYFWLEGHHILEFSIVRLLAILEFKTKKQETKHGKSKSETVSLAR